MSATAKSFRIGEPVRRKEDRRLLTGRGCFADDVNLPGQAYVAFVRSAHAHAWIRTIEAERALQVPGVIAVLTGHDFFNDGLKPIENKTFSLHPAELVLVNKDGTDVFNVPDYPLPLDRVRFAGEPVAMVVAENVAAAKDGAERVHIEHELLPSVTYTVAAAEPKAPCLREEHHSNVCIDAEVGNAAATEAAFAKAAHVVGIKTWIPRVTGVPMEPRAAAASYDRDTERYTIHASSGATVRLKTDIAKVLNVPDDRVHLVLRDVGGNFGTRGAIYPELPLLAWAARRIGRPVKWTGDRVESFLSDYQGRDLAVEAELALDAEGNFLAMRGSNIGNLGAHTGNFSMVQKGVEIMSSIYRMPAAFFRVRAVMSNTAPTRPYRSAGRPEVIFVMERLIDLAARQCGFDRIALRERNLVSEAELPYRNPFGMVYDSGAYHAVMAKALEIGDWKGFSRRKAEARTRGRLRGIGVSNYVDTATGIPRERAEITILPDGHVDLVIGTISNGQGHETSFAQLVHEWLGVPFDAVRLLTGDTDIVKVGGGTHSGRGMRLASIVIWKASQLIVEKGKRLAALLLQEKETNIDFSEGRFFVHGSGHSITLFEIAMAIDERTDLPHELREPLTGVCDEIVNDASFPYGCQVCEVEVDPAVGTLEIIRYTAVDDVGRAVNPLIIHGQTHGGIAQGVGQALLEQCIYDSSTGQLISASFMDYAMPRADIFPFFTTEIAEVPSTTHPLGMRPAGEGGTTPALGVMINAIVDALSDYGVKHIEMPATPERIWRAINGLQDRSRTAA